MLSQRSCEREWMATLFVWVTDNCPFHDLFVNRFPFLLKESSPRANPNLPHDYDNHEKLKGKGLLT